jgi:hypothetical protein
MGVKTMFPIGAINKVQSAGDLVAQFKREFAEAKARLAHY